MVKFTLSLLLLSTNLMANELNCLAQAVYHEARGSTKNNQIMVANVVLNRVKSKGYPNTICKVIHQKGQFPWAKKGKKINKKSKEWKDSVKIARQVMNRDFDRSKGATHFHDLSVKPRWAKKFAKTVKDKNLVFYRQPKLNG